MIWTTKRTDASSMETRTPRTRGFILEREKVVEKRRTVVKTVRSLWLYSTAVGQSKLGMSLP